VREELAELVALLALSLLVFLSIYLLPHLILELLLGC